MENKAITPIQQFSILRHEFPGSTGSVHCGTMTWFGEFTPSALSDTYRLKITYTLGWTPKAYIVSPKPLPLAEGTKRLPHTYNYSNGKQQLCLFLPKAEPLFIGQCNGCIIMRYGYLQENGWAEDMAIGMQRNKKIILLEQLNRATLHSPTSLFLGAIPVGKFTVGTTATYTNASPAASREE